jgi:hypothetical protein
MQVHTEEYVYQALLFHDDRIKLYDRYGEDEVFQDMFEWCDTTFGELMWYNSYAEIDDCDIFAFRKAEHRNWFVIKWS